MSVQVSGSRCARLLAFVFVIVPWVARAQAQYPISGSIRFQIGDGLPVPFTLAPPPQGKVAATQFAWVSQTTAGPDPRKITIPVAAFTNQAAPMVIPLYKAEPEVFQVFTSVSLRLPDSPETFPLDNVLQANGRTGPPTLWWCPGLPLPAPRGSQTSYYDPHCTSPKNPSYLLAGRVRYHRTANQFGGPLSGRVVGWVDVALKGSAGAPCHYAQTPQCTAVFVAGPLLETGVIGGPLNRTGITPGSPPNPGRFQVGVTENGLITAITPNGLGPGQGNPVTSWAVPWTTGQLINTAYTILGGTEAFTLTGSDARVDGVGNLSLVSGALSVRGYSGANANRGWLTMTVPEPAALVSAALALLLLGSCHRMVRRRYR